MVSIHNLTSPPSSKLIGRLFNQSINQIKSNQSNESINQITQSCYSICLLTIKKIQTYNLLIFEIYDCVIIGTIPPNLAKIHNLEEIYLGDNKLKNGE